jgi:acyl carrier protein
MELTELRESVTERVIRVIAANQHSAPGAVRAESTFQDLGIDSLDGLQIVFGLEEEFGIDIPDDAARGFTSVQQVVEAILHLLQAKAPPAPVA